MFDDTEYGDPVFKVLAKTDISKGSAKVGGILITKEMQAIFPDLGPRTTDGDPSIKVSVDIWLDGRRLGDALSTYGAQTWRGTRRAEMRLTARLGTLTSKAVIGDIAVIERHSHDEGRFRITLAPRDSELFRFILEQSGGKKSGRINLRDAPVTDGEVEAASDEIRERGERPFVLFDPDARKAETKRTAVVRDKAFHGLVLDAYGGVCCIDGTALRTLKGGVGVDGAHIVPRSKLGADDVRNGLALGKLHHWAFDALLFGINSDHMIELAPWALDLPGNAHLKAIAGRKIRLPDDPGQHPADEALAWHMERVRKGE